MPRSVCSMTQMLHDSELCNSYDLSWCYLYVSQPVVVCYTGLQRLQLEQKNKAEQRQHTASPTTVYINVTL